MRSYLSIVQIRTRARSRADKLKVCVKMSLLKIAAFERLVDRFAPALLLALGLTAAAGMVMNG